MSKHTCTCIYIYMYMDTDRNACLCVQKMHVHVPVTMSVYLKIDIITDQSLPLFFLCFHLRMWSPINNINVYVYISKHQLIIHYKTIYFLRFQYNVVSLIILVS